MPRFLLKDLLEGVADSGRSDIPIDGLACDSRRAAPGGIFFALEGSKTSGRLYAEEAVRRGAAVVISQSPPPDGFKAAWVRVPDAAKAMGQIADRFFGRPCAELSVIGVTGTNGKTTVAYFLESILQTWGAKPGVIGTISHRGPGLGEIPAVNTTPLSLDLLEMFRRLKDSGATHVAMEASSHALALGRVEDIAFDAAIFTDLKRDHLDFHKTLKAYFEAKAHLFELLERSPKKNRAAVVNSDSKCASALKNRIRSARTTTYGVENPADVSARNLLCGLDGSRFDLIHKGRKFPAAIHPAGRHNVSNALAAAAALIALGVPENSVITGLGALRKIPGRLELVEGSREFKVFVDYAHTDSALESVLGSLREMTGGRLITVFGCGGQRDKTKRGPMGIAACRLSATVFITNDNPRDEDPQDIFEDIESAILREGFGNYKIIPERGEAIFEAVKGARAGDVVLIAGKGHEDRQILAGKSVPFDDRELAAAVLRNMR